jgi:hypothetical protein
MANATGNAVERGRTFDTTVFFVGLTLAIAASVAAFFVWTLLLSDEQRDPQYRQAQAENRSIGPTNGRLDDGSKVGAATFYEDDGRICTIYGPPGDRGDLLYCVTDTPDEADIVKWEVEPERNIELAVLVVDGANPHIEFEFEGRTPGHALGWFQIPKPAVVAVYIGPPWQGLDVVSGVAG